MPRLIHVRAWYLLLALSVTVSLRAQQPKLQAHAALAPVHDVTAAAYRQHLDALRQVVAECGRVVTACDAAKIGDDDRVQEPGRTAYVVRYGWLRDLMEDRNDPSHSLRRELLPHAEQRLVEDEAALEHAEQVGPLTAAERASRDAVMRGGEFRTTEDYSLTERLAEWFNRMLSKLFGGASNLGRMAPWLGTMLEWGSLLLAVVLLVLWIYRALDRQRIALGKLTGDAAREAAHAESRAWAEKAKEHADHGEWRDAVHCLYWASVVILEDRRTLRPNATRTPREALKLIDVSSAAREPLSAQTAEFERIWYGLQPAAPQDYEAALGYYASLRGATA